MVVICKQIYEADAHQKSNDQVKDTDTSVDVLNNSINCKRDPDKIAEANPDDYSSCFHSSVYLLSQLFFSVIIHSYFPFTISLRTMNATTTTKTRRLA